MRVPETSPEEASEIVLFDLEYTAWAGSRARCWAASWEHREVVEIGAVILDRVTLEERASFGQLVRPRINARLSRYFVELTGIAQADVDRAGLDFADAMAAFQAFCGSRPLFSYGMDAAVLEECRALYALGDRMAPVRGGDIRPWFLAAGVPVERVSSGEVAAFLGLETRGTVHRALDDMRGLAAGMRHLAARGAAFPFLEEAAP